MTDKTQDTWLAVYAANWHRIDDELIIAAWSDQLVSRFGQANVIRALHEISARQEKGARPPKIPDVRAVIVELRRASADYQPRQECALCNDSGVVAFGALRNAENGRKIVKCCGATPWCRPNAEYCSNGNGFTCYPAATECLCSTGERIATVKISKRIVKDPAAYRAIREAAVDAKKIMLREEAEGRYFLPQEREAELRDMGRAVFGTVAAHMNAGASVEVA